MDIYKRGQLRAAAARLFDIETYNRLVESVQGTRAKRRLRFWQEELLRRLSAVTGEDVAHFNQFLTVFGGAESLPYPKKVITKDDFLGELHTNPWVLSVDGRMPPDDWLAAAWEMENVREAHTCELARTVSKVGDLAFENEFLTALGRALSVERQVELFNRIRDRSPSRECEFRGQFERFFPRSREVLPPPLPQDEINDEIGPGLEPFGRLASQEPWTPVEGDDIPF